MFEPNDLKTKNIFDGTKCPTRKLSQIIDIPLKSFLKHIKTFIGNSLAVFIKLIRDVNGYTQMVTLGVVTFSQVFLTN